MLYEIINMSDPYTIEANSLDVAFVACILLGAGQYSLQPLEEGGEQIPFAMFGTVAEDWCQQHFQLPIKGLINLVCDDPVKRIELADCLDSCLIGNARDRETYRIAIEKIDNPVKRESFRSERHDRMRSSLNDIGGRARKMAENFRKAKEQPVVKAPQQVFSVL